MRSVAIALAIGFTSLTAGAVTNLTYKAEVTVKESFDGNVYLQDEIPSPAVTSAVRPFQESFVTSVTPRVALEYDPCAAFGVSLGYAPEVTFYHAAPSEDYVAHRGNVAFRGAVEEAPWEQANSFIWIDGSDECLVFGGPGGAPAIGGVPIRDRRAAFVYRGGFKAAWTFNERWFIRPVATAYVHEFFTKQFDSRLPQFAGYENYVDRNDVNGGLDAGVRIADNTRVFAGYRYGYQDEGHLITEPGIEYDNRYHRVLFGIEGRPVPWLRLAVVLGPDFHHSTAVTRTNFNGNYTVLFVDSTVTILPTAQDSIALTMRQYTQPAFASCSIYQDTTYDLTGRHKFDERWAGAAGFRAYVGDWRAPVRREGWIYNVSGSLSCAFNDRISAEAAYSYDWADSVVPNTSGREFTRHLGSLSVKCIF